MAQHAQGHLGIADSAHDVAGAGVEQARRVKGQLEFRGDVVREAVADEASDGFAGS